MIVGMMALAICMSLAVGFGLTLWETYLTLTKWE